MYNNGRWDDMQTSQSGLEVQNCSYFSELKIKIDSKQELSMTSLVLTSLALYLLTFFFST
jgi:hypothetical protein